MNTEQNTTTAAEIYAGLFRGIYDRLERLEVAVAQMQQPHSDQHTKPDDWMHIDEAPRDGTLIEVWVPKKHGLSGFICDCAWHPDAGFCVDELRQPAAWRVKR